MQVRGDLISLYLCLPRPCFGHNHNRKPQKYRKRFSKILIYAEYYVTEPCGGVVKEDL